MNKLTRRNITDIIVLVVAVVAITIVGAILNPFTTEEKVQPNNFIAFPEPGNTSRSFRAIINVYSHTFAAQSDIDVNVKLFPDERSIKDDISGKKLLPDRLYMMFEGSVCDPKKEYLKDRYAPISSCALPLALGEENGQLIYRNFTTFYYPVDGNYGALLDVKVPDITPANSTTLKFISITSADTAVNYENNKIIYFATIFAIYVTVATLYLEARHYFKSKS